MGRPKSGVSAPKGNRLSLADRFSLHTEGTIYTPPVSEPSPLSRQLQSAVQSAPQKNNEVKPAPKTVAKPAKAPAKKAPAKKSATKPASDNQLESNMKDYASYKKAKDMGTFKGTFKNWTEHNS